MDSAKIQREGKKWVIVGAGDAWISKRKFPARWKAELALQIYNKNGRVSDYFAAMRVHRSERSDRAEIHLQRLRTQAISRYGSTATAKLDPATLVLVQRQPGGHAVCVPLRALDDLHLRWVSGGVAANLDRPGLFARMWCDAIPEEDKDAFGHSCKHGPGPHEILVWIGKTGNRRDLFERMLASTRS